MKLSDYVVDFLTKTGTTHNFLISGGAVVHLVDSTGRHENIQHVSTQHEQSCAAAADGYARTSKRLGLAMTTSGPGATNLLTSICNAFFDSVPMICITGQVARFRIRPNKQLRQRGFQETDLQDIYKSVTKYVALVTDPKKIRYELEKAIYMAREGRPGPTLLDLPDDLQREEVDPETLEGFTPPVQRKTLPNQEVSKLFKLIKESKRPVMIVGQGVHTAHAEKSTIKFARQFGIPTLLTWGAADLLTYDDPLNMGGVGVVGPRSGNFAAQTSDLVIAIGTRLSQQITGGKQNLFAPRAQKVMVDIDKAELDKFGPDTFTLDLPIHSHLQTFFDICESLYDSPTDAYAEWRAKIQGWRERYPICPKEYYAQSERINPYVFSKELSKRAQEGEVIVTDTGANICWVLQAFETKANQQIFSAWNHTPMGYALPASIGAAFGSGKDVLCLTGDGGLMMCLQELATVRRYDLPIKIFIYDNQCQGTMKQTLDIWLKSNYVAVDVPSGLYFPDYQKLAKTFDLPFYCLKNHADVDEQLTDIYQQSGPLVCQLQIVESQRIVPMLKFGGGLEDLDPKLPQEEIDAIIHEEELLNI